MRKREKFHTHKHKHSKKIVATPELREPVIANALSDKLKISEDVFAHAPIVMGYGCHRFCIENYRNIIEYTDSLIRIQTKMGKIYILGKNLVIAYFRDDAMCVMGDISSVEYH